MADLIIDLITPEGKTLADTIIPGETLVKAVVSELIDQLGLQRHQVDYSLYWEKQNLTLDNERSLAECGVRSGEQVKLVSSVKVETPEDASITGEIPIYDKTVEVVLALPDLNTREKDRLDRDTRVEDLVRLLVKKYQLPAFDNRNPGSAYRLRSKYKGDYLLPADTLRSVGIPSQDTISVIRAEIAG